MLEKERGGGALEILSQRAGNQVRVILAGELDMASAPHLEHALRSIESEAPAQLFLDLDDLRFIDSTGLHVILAAHERAREVGRRLALICGQRAVLQVFELTDTDRSLEILEDAGAQAATGRSSVVLLNLDNPCR